MNSAGGYKGKRLNRKQDSPSRDLKNRRKVEIGERENNGRMLKVALSLEMNSTE